MEKWKEKLVHYYTKDKELDINLFKILGTAGILVSLVSGTQSILSGISVTGGLIDYAAILASILLLWFVDKTGKYVIGYIITDVTVFMILFSILFFQMGGMDGSMPYFFTFGIVFVFLMFHGKLLMIMETLQVAVYTFVCVYSIKFPASVTPFATSEDRFIDQLSGILFSGVGIGLIFLAYIARYKKEQKIAEEANLAKSRFLANMSHEIRTPINMMMGMNEMVIREADSDAIREYASNAEDAGKQLLFTVNQILEYSKLEVGKDEPVPAAYSLFHMLDGLKDYFAKEAAKKGLDFYFIPEEGIEPYLVGDMRKISQILTNLLSNAMKYTREGRVELHVRNLGVAKGIQSLRFEVKDTGIGIQESELEKIFESFERSDLLKNRNIEGTGLGLAIADNLARMMGSRLEVESVYGEGSTFFFTLDQPVGKAEEAEGTEGLQESFVAPDARILVVDDNPMNLNVAKSLLKKTMVQVATAGGAEECYEKCREESFDLIFMDLMMPAIDGLEALKEVKKFDGYAAVPVVALTADVSAETEERLLKSGFDGYLTKPIDWRKLERCLMEKLPPALVTKTHESAAEVLSGEEEQQFSDLLARYDIELSEGLHYMGGDILQYAKVAEYFTAHADAGLKDLEECMRAEDYENAVYILHSLKGNARNVGSIELHYLSKRLEKRCREGDTDYLKKSLELLVFEWKRVKEGLLAFLKAFRPIGERALREQEKVSSSGKEATMEALLEEIENFHQQPAINLIDEMLGKCDNEEERDRLAGIRNRVAHIEFEEAEAAVREILKG